MLKEIDSRLLDFSNQYVKSNHKSDCFRMLRNMKELQDKQATMEKIAQEMTKKFAELSVAHSTLVRPPAATSSANQVILVLQSLK